MSYSSLQCWVTLSQHIMGQILKSLLRTKFCSDSYLGVTLPLCKAVNFPCSPAISPVFCLHKSHIFCFLYSTLVEFLWIYSSVAKQNLVLRFYSDKTIDLDHLPKISTWMSAPLYPYPPTSSLAFSVDTITPSMEFLKGSGTVWEPGTVRGWIRGGDS